MTVEEFKALPQNEPILIRHSEGSTPYYVVIKTSEKPDYYTNEYYLTEAGGEGYAKFFIYDIDDWCTMEDLDRFFKEKKQAMKDSLETTEEPDMGEER